MSATTSFPSADSGAGPYHIIVNPVSGHQTAPDFVAQHVVPLLKYLGVSYETHQTSGIRDAGRIGQILSNTSSDTSGKVKVIIAGGDGTAHEMIEGVLGGLSDGPKGEEGLGRWELIILPLGTANALYSSLFPLSFPPPTVTDTIQDFFVSNSTPQEVISKLYSLISSLSSLSTTQEEPSKQPRRLPITLTSLLPPTPSLPPSPPTPQPTLIPSHIVLSTSLHASLLHTSESLRSTHPGLDRFKLAAEQNLGVFFSATLVLHPSLDGSVRQYNPTTQGWVESYTHTSSDGRRVTLDGPFTYVLSSTTTPRLEPSFVITPTLSRFPPPQGDEPPTMDLTIMRPLRDPSIRALGGGGEANERWKYRAREVLGWAYKEGGHVDLTYADGEGETEVRGKGEVVVETFRCGGFEWIPQDPHHEPSHLICADGSIYHIPSGGKALVEIMSTKNDESGFYVWA